MDSSGTTAAYRLTGAKWGNPVQGTGGGQVSWSFSLEAAIGYDFDAALSGAYQGLVRMAFDAWERVADIDFVEVAASAGAAILLGWDTYDGPWGVVGEAWWQTRGGTITHAEVMFDSAESWSLDPDEESGWEVNFYAVALHEIGHAIGLDHASDPGAIMHAMGAGNRLTPDDIAGIRAVYGAAGPEPDYILSGTAGDDVIRGDGRNDTIRDLLGGNDQMFGGAGNDTIMGGPGDDRIDGGPGLDWALYLGARADYLVAAGGGTITVRDLGSGFGEGRDSLSGIERLGFADGNLAFDIDGAAGQAYRLYQAAFARQPDTDGLAYWIDQMDAGLSLYAAGQGFVGSAEFAALYGNAGSRAELVGRLYENILERPGEPAGIAYWTEALASGRADLATVLVGFSESAENQALTGPAISDGIWYA